MGNILVVGGSGFIGGAIQRHVLDLGIEDSFTFTYSKNRENILPNLDNARIDLLCDNYSRDIDKYPIAIYLAGNSDHGLAKRDPSVDLMMNAMAFLNFVKHFTGSIVILSSQAVYFGLQGEVDEGIEHTPTIPYGISKRMLEAYAKYFQKNGCLSSTWTFRLMYTFGEGEKARRLVPLCASAASNGGSVKIFGGGRSYINPLPSNFVAEVLVRAALDITDKDSGFAEITNLNHPDVIKVADVVKFLNDLKSFHYTIEASGEDWPVTFWGKTTRLSGYLKAWNLKFPDPWDSLKRYYLKKIDDEVRK